MTLKIDEFIVADPADAWTRAGFSVDANAVCRIGGVGIRLVGRDTRAAPAATSDDGAAPAATSDDGAAPAATSDQGTGTGIVAWSLRGLPSDDSVHDIDGIPTTSSGEEFRAEPLTHPNGVTSIDHVVLLSPDLRRTVTSLAAVGADPRRERDGELGGRPIRQIFFRLGEVIVEAVGSPDTASEGPSTLWGMTYVVADIDATASFFGDRTAPVKDAVQPGRRITTLRHQEFGMSVRSAFMSAHVRER
jgi:hypothetical protein